MRESVLLSIGITAGYIAHGGTCITPRSLPDDGILDTTFSLSLSQGVMPSVWLVLASALCCFAHVSGESFEGCKAFPGDKEWPSKNEWDAFNATVGGRLVATVPLGAPCHGSGFDNSTCEYLKSQWQSEGIQYV